MYHLSTWGAGGRPGQAEGRRRHRGPAVGHGEQRRRRQAGSRLRRGCAIGSSSCLQQAAAATRACLPSRRAPAAGRRSCCCCAAAERRRCSCLLPLVLASWELGLALVLLGLGNRESLGNLAASSPSASTRSNTCSQVEGRCLRHWLGGGTALGGRGARGGWRHWEEGSRGGLLTSSPLRASARRGRYMLDGGIELKSKNPRQCERRRV